MPNLNEVRDIIEIIDTRMFTLPTDLQPYIRKVLDFAQTVLDVWKPEKSFEDFLAEKHAEQYIGTKDTMVDDFSDWLCDLELDDLLKYGDKYAKEICLYQAKCLLRISSIMEAVYQVGLVEGRNGVSSEKGFVVNDAMGDVRNLFVGDKK